MIRLSLFTALSFISFLSFAQSDFQKGYFIDDSGTRQEGYVSIKSWSDNPRTFAFKTEPASSSRIISVGSTTEFGSGVSKYVRFIGQVDNSSNKSRKMSKVRTPEWVSDSLFVRMLVDGKADLFYCQREGDSRFFYRVDDGAMEQLIFKLYDKATVKNAPPEVAKYNEYQNQLRQHVNCLQYTFERLKVLRYEIAVLTKYFTEQNECSGGNEFTAQDDVSRRMIGIRLTPGISSAQMDSYKTNGVLYEAYERELSFRMGAEIELTLPFNRKKWAVWFEPALQSYKANGTDSAARSITYTSFELALGARHYFYLGKNASIFLNGAGIFDIPTQNSGGWEGRNNARSSQDKTISFAAGVGAVYRRFSVEARYYATRKMNSKAGFPLGNGDTFEFAVNNEYQKISLIVGFKVF